MNLTLMCGQSLCLGSISRRKRLPWFASSEMSETEMQGIYRSEVALRGCASLNPSVESIQIKAKSKGRAVWRNQT